MTDLPNIDIENRLLALEAENAILRREIAAMKDRGAPPKRIPSPPEPCVRISSPAAVSSFVMPSDDQLNELCNIVIAKYPVFGDVAGQGFYGSTEEREEAWWRQYKAAFQALGDFKRLDGPDHGKYLSFHVSAVEGHLRTMGKGGMTLRAQPFMTAALAHGDIPHSGIGLHHLGHGIHLGLSQYSGRSAGDAWKGVLQTRQLLVASPGEVFNQWAASSQRVIQAGR